MKSLRDAFTGLLFVLILLVAAACAPAASAPLPAANAVHAAGIIAAQPVTLPPEAAHNSVADVTRFDSGEVAMRSALARIPLIHSSMLDLASSGHSQAAASTAGSASRQQAHHSVADVTLFDSEQAAGPGSEPVGVPQIHSGLIDGTKYANTQPTGASPVASSASSAAGSFQSKWLGIAGSLGTQAGANSVTSAPKDSKWLQASAGTARPTAGAAAAGQHGPVTLPITGSPSKATQACGPANIMGIQGSAVEPLALTHTSGPCATGQPPSGR